MVCLKFYIKKINTRTMSLNSNAFSSWVHTIHFKKMHVITSSAHSDFWLITSLPIGGWDHVMKWCVSTWMGDHLDVVLQMLTMLAKSLAPIDLLRLSCTKNLIVKSVSSKPYLYVTMQYFQQQGLLGGGGAYPFLSMAVRALISTCGWCCVS